jgi:hypothetical protein
MVTRHLLYPWMGGMPQGARDGGVAQSHGWMVCHKEPGMVVWPIAMDRIVFRNNLECYAVIAAFVLAPSFQNSHIPSHGG